MFCVFDLTNYYYSFLILLAPLAVESLLSIVVLFAMTIAGQLAFRYSSDLVLFPLYSLMVFAVLLYFVARTAFPRRSVARA